MVYCSLVLVLFRFKDNVIRDSKCRDWALLTQLKVIQYGNLEKLRILIVKAR